MLKISRSFVVAFAILAGAFQFNASADDGQLVPAPVLPELAQLMDLCNETILNSDYVACPIADSYSYPKSLSMAEVEALIADELGFSLTRSEPGQGVQVLLPRINQYYRWMVEWPEVGMASQYRRSVDLMLDVLARLGHASGAVTFIDRDTYWAPSVNASAALVVNPESGTITIFMIGDTDG